MYVTQHCLNLNPHSSKMERKSNKIHHLVFEKLENRFSDRWLIYRPRGLKGLTCPDTSIFCNFFILSLLRHIEYIKIEFQNFRNLNMKNSIMF